MQLKLFKNIKTLIGEGLQCIPTQQSLFEGGHSFIVMHELAEPYLINLLRPQWVFLRCTCSYFLTLLVNKFMAQPPSHWCLLSDHTHELILMHYFPMPLWHLCFPWKYLIIIWRNAFIHELMSILTFRMLLSVFYLLLILHKKYCILALLT